jgi:hypothetical protein
MSAKLVPTFADRRCIVVSVTDPYGSFFGFPDRNLDSTFFKNHNVGFSIYDETLPEDVSTRDHILQFAVTLLSMVTSSLPLLGSGFQRRTLPILWVPELSPASATSFSQQPLRTVDLQQVPDCNFN